MSKHNYCSGCGYVVDSLIHGGKHIEAKDLTRCHVCRMAQFPRHVLPHSQYDRYWIDFAKKERKNIMEEIMKTIESWVRQLAEAVECDADYGDPILCLEEVELITKKMRKMVMDYKNKQYVLDDPK